MEIYHYIMVPVINRCQDALKLLTKEKKFSGGLFVKSSNENRVKNDIKYQSPLRKIPVVRFGYTTPIKVTEEYDTYTAALDKLMKRLGIPRDVGKSSEFKEDINNKQTSGSTISSVDENIKTIEQQQQQKQPVTNLISEVVCNECKKRKSLVYTDAGTQCEDMKFTFSVSTQVTEEDINFMKGKKESLALLTPAQLLEKEKNKDEDGREASTSTSTVNASNSSNEASTSKCGMKRDSNEKKSSSSFFKKMDDHTYRRGPDSLFNRQRNYTNFDGYPPYFNENRQAEFHNQSQYSPPSIGNYSRFSPPPIYRMPHPPRDEYYNDFYYNNYRNPPDPHNRYGYEF